MQPKHLKIIACNIFMREVCRAIAESPHRIDPEFTEVGEHVQSDRLMTSIQDRIDAASEAVHAYDAILLGYGLCGNATVGLRARRIPLVIPRAHDCCTILLGSRKAFAQHFGDTPSRPFSSAGYMDRGEYYLRRDDQSTHLHYGDGYAELVEQYGEDNAAYVWETLHPPALQSFEQEPVFIDIPETSHLGHAARFAAQASQDGKRCLRLTGNLRLLRALTQGPWTEEEFLTVPPGHRTVGRYDTDIVIDSQPIDDSDG